MVAAANSNLETWQDFRMTGIGGSEAACAIGHYDSRVDLANEKRGFAEPFAGNHRTRMGKLHEPTIGQWYSEAHESHTLITSAEICAWENSDREAPPYVDAITSARVEWTEGHNASFRSRDFSHMFCSPDGLILDEAGSWGLYEAKATEFYSRKDWGERLPIYVWVQVQHNMTVLGLDWARVAVLFGAFDLDVFHVPRDPVFCADMIEEESKFWTAVQTGAPIEELNLDAIKVPAELEGLRIILPPKSAADADQWAHWKAVKKEAETNAKNAKARLAQALGAAEIGELFDGRYLVGSTGVDGVRRYRVLGEAWDD